MWVGDPDVINHAKFGNNRLKGYKVVAVLRVTPSLSDSLSCVCVSV